MRNDMAIKKSMELMAQAADFELMPLDTDYDFDDKRRFQKMQLTSAQKMQISSLIQQMPMAASAGNMVQAYTATFPKGIPHTLTALKQGGYGSMVRADGRFAGTASFNPMVQQAAALGAFTAMSAVTGQYFLAEINSRMTMMNQKLDKILEFLYSDKKAELMAELNFTKYAHQNYASIVVHEQQRMATIVSLQAAQKVAMKDIEFYMGDLDRCAGRETKKYAEIEETARDASRIGKCLELSLQLYATASLLEVYYAGNFDECYLTNVEETVGFYINRCEKRVIGAFNRLSAKVEGYKATPLEKCDKMPLTKQINAFLEARDTGDESPMRKTMHAVLNAATQKAEYYLTPEGDVYARIS